jgi:hypothetical protein
MALKRTLLGPWHTSVLRSGNRSWASGWIVPPRRLAGSAADQPARSSALRSARLLMGADRTLLRGRPRGCFRCRAARWRFALEGFGKRAGFGTGWALVLVFHRGGGVLRLFLAWILDYLIPGIRGPALYSFRGSEIHGRQSRRGTRRDRRLYRGQTFAGVQTAGKFQDWFPTARSSSALVFLVAGIAGGSTSNLPATLSAPRADGPRSQVRSRVTGPRAVVPGGIQRGPTGNGRAGPKAFSLKVLGRVTVGSSIRRSASSTAW